MAFAAKSLADQHTVYFTPRRQNLHQSAASPKQSSFWKRGIILHHASKKSAVGDRLSRPQPLYMQSASDVIKTPKLRAPIICPPRTLPLPSIRLQHADHITVPGLLKDICRPRPRIEAIYFPVHALVASMQWAEVLVISATYVTRFRSLRVTVAIQFACGRFPFAGQPSKANNFPLVQLRCIKTLALCGLT